MSFENFELHKKSWLEFEEVLKNEGFSEINDALKCSTDHYVAFQKKIDFNYILIVFCNLALKGFNVRAEIHLKNQDSTLTKVMKNFLAIANFYSDEFTSSPIPEIELVQHLIIDNNLHLNEAKKKVGGKQLQRILFQSDSGSLVGTDSVLAGRYCIALAKYKNGISLNEIASSFEESKTAMKWCSSLHKKYSLPK